MVYDSFSESLKDKLKQLENPDPRFLKHNSPHPTVTDHTPILAFPLTRVTTLPNGLRIATESNLAARTATVGAWIEAGSRFETNGTAHFVEHMIFKGTERRTTRELEEEVENMGGHLNAYASREHTVVCLKTMDWNVTQALDILADVLQNPKFDYNRIERERDVILRELEEIEGDTEEDLFDHLHATAFQHTPLGRAILGPAQNIKLISKDNLRNYVATTTVQLEW